MKKIFLLCAICACAMMAKAANEVTICGTIISDEMAAAGIIDSLNKVDGITATGSITYNSATKVLTMNNASVTCSLNEYLMKFATWAGDFSVVLVGDNVLRSTYDGYKEGIVTDTYTNHITFSGEGNLNISVVKWYPIFLKGGTITIDNTTIVALSDQNAYSNGIDYNASVPGGSLVCNKAKLTTGNIHNLSGITLTGCEITQPASATIVEEEGAWRVEKGSADIEKIIVIQPSGATAIDNTPFPSGDGRGEASKLLRNGQIYLLRGDKTYTITGVEVK